MTDNRSVSINQSHCALTRGIGKHVLDAAIQFPVANFSVKQLVRRDSTQGDFAGLSVGSRRPTRGGEIPRSRHPEQNHTCPALAQKFNGSTNPVTGIVKGKNFDLFDISVIGAASFAYAQWHGR